MLPNDPRLRTLTLEQRNFVIESMNEDARISSGGTTTSDGGGNDSWLHVPEDDFDLLGDVPIDEDDLWEQVTERVGLEQMLQDEQMFKSTLANFKQKHEVQNNETNNLQKGEMSRLQKLAKLKQSKNKDDDGYSQL